MNSSSLSHDYWRERLARSGYFLAAVLLHLILFIMLATWIVFRVPRPLEDSTRFARIPVPTSQPPPPSPPATSGGETASDLDPSQNVVPPPEVIPAIHLIIPANVNLPPTKDSLPILPPSSSQIFPQGPALTDDLGNGPGTGPGDQLGSLVNNGTPMLEGYLYDLKQTRDRRATNMDPGGYHNKLKAFIAGGWDAAILGDYYKAAKPVYTSSIFIPIIKAEDGPKVFGVENEVKPNMYCIWYKATVIAPRDGIYRFVGAADDILLVRADGRTVLDGSDFPVDDDLRKRQTQFQMTHFNPTFPNNANFWVGSPMHITAGQKIDLDVLIGEEPGGRSDYFLYIQRDEDPPHLQSNGAPLLPVFQLDPKPITLHADPMTYPPFSDTPAPWTAVPADRL